MKQVNCSYKDDVIRSPNGGFTLLELLISISVLALLMPLIFGGFIFGARIWDRTEGVLHQQDLSLIRTFLRRQISMASLPAAISYGGGSLRGFSGDGDKLQFVARNPDAAGAPGRGIFMLALTPTKSNKKSLALTWRPEFMTEHAWQQIQTSSEITLVENIEKFSVSYFGVVDHTKPAAWSDKWSPGGNLPKLLRISIVFPTGDKRKWSPLIIAPVATAETLCQFNPVSQSCGAMLP